MALESFIKLEKVIYTVHSNVIYPSFLLPFSLPKPNVHIKQILISPEQSIRYGSAAMTNLYH